MLNYYKTTLIRNAQGGPLISVFVKISVCYCNFSFALDFNFQGNNENLHFLGLKLVSSLVNVACVADALNLLYIASAN